MKPKLRVPILLLAGAAVCWTVSGLIGSRMWSLLVQAFMFILIVAALYIGLFDLGHRIISLVKAMNEAREAGKMEHAKIQLETLHVVKTMSEAQLAAIGRLRTEIEFVADDFATPMYTWVLPFARIPWEFYGDEFYKQCSETHLAPVRRWSNGSKKHEWADAITAHMIDHGYAVYNPGNESTTWVSEKKRVAGWASVGIDTEVV